MTDVAAPTPQTSLAPAARTAIALIPFWVALLTLPLFLLTDLPIAAWLLATGAWAFNSLLTRLVVRLVNGVSQTLAVAVAGFSMIVRAWVVVLVIFWVGADLHVGSTTVGLGRKDIALPALLLFVVLVTFDIGLRVAHELMNYKSGIDKKHEDAR
jgi:hypothetical protein